MGADEDTRCGRSLIVDGLDGQAMERETPSGLCRKGPGKCVTMEPSAAEPSGS